jgi:4-hydroxy-L-threonine phosphate dehydrogenase PdxA
MFSEAGVAAHSGRDIFPVPGPDHKTAFNIAGKEEIYTVKYEAVFSKVQQKLCTLQLI